MDKQKMDLLQPLFNERAAIEQKIQDILDGHWPGVTALKSAISGDTPPHTPEEAAPAKRAYHKKGSIASDLVSKGKPGWTRKFDKCQSCGSAEKKHIGKGFCSSCYFKQPKTAPLGKRGRKAREYRPDSELTSSAANDFSCNDCGLEFVSVLDKLDVVCPKCKSTHIS